jgi:hypothetical protein
MILRLRFRKKKELYTATKIASSHSQKIKALASRE